MAFSKKDQFDPRLARLAALADALSHPARLAILQTLAAKKSCVCGEVVEVLPLAQSTVSQHLKELRDSGLIRGEIDGARSCYCIDTERFDALRAELDEFLGEISRGVPSSPCC